MKVRDKVEILRKDIFHLQHRKNRNSIGTITHINGACILVRPMGCKWEIELYPNEVETMMRKAYA